MDVPVDTSGRGERQGQTIQCPSAKMCSHCFVSFQSYTLCIKTHFHSACGVRLRLTHLHNCYIGLSLSSTSAVSWLWCIPQLSLLLGYAAMMLAVLPWNWRTDTQCLPSLFSSIPLWVQYQAGRWSLACLSCFPLFFGSSFWWAFSLSTLDCPFQESI